MEFLILMPIVLFLIAKVYMEKKNILIKGNMNFILLAACLVISLFFGFITWLIRFIVGVIF